MFRCACFLGLLAALVSGQIPSFGFCPQYSPMEDFDMNRFLGKWYEAERYFTFSDIGSRCVVTDYAKSISGKIYVSNEYTSRLTGIKRVVNGVVQLNEKNGEGTIPVKYTTQPLSTESTLVVLDTDYDTYAVVWSCTGLGPVHAENAWLMTRERLPAGPILQKAYGILDKFRINRSFFVKTDQEGCVLAASDLNAAQGITSVSTVVEQTGEEQRQQAIKKKVFFKTALTEEEQKSQENPETVTQQEDAEEVVKNQPVTSVADLIIATSQLKEDEEENDAIVLKAADAEEEDGVAVVTTTEVDVAVEVKETKENECNKKNSESDKKDIQENIVNT